MRATTSTSAYLGAQLDRKWLAEGQGKEQEVSRLRMPADRRAKVAAAACPMSWHWHSETFIEICRSAKMPARTHVKEFN